MERWLEIMSHPLGWPVAACLAIGLAAYVFSRRLPKLCAVLAVAAAGVVLVGGASILAGPRDAAVHESWIALTESVSLDLDLARTSLGMLVMLGSGVFALLVSLYSVRAMSGAYWEGKFYSYLIWALAGACMVALAGNLLVLLVGWEIITLMLFLMVNQGRGDAKVGGAKAYGVLGFADACLLLAIALLCATPGGSGNLLLSGPAVSVAGMGAMGYFVYVLILIAALAKAGAVPLHTWVPAVAQDAPTPVLAYLPAALDKLLGIYLLAVLSLRMFRPDPTLQVVLMVIGATTILAAVLMAMMQHNLKRLLSFHAVSQVGYMVLGIGTGTLIGIVGGLFHMINNALYKSNLFLMAGTVGRATGSDEIEDMGGLARLLPVTFICGLISAAAISGVPPLNGFASKWLVYQGALQVSEHSRGLAVALVVVAVFGSALTLASFIKVVYAAFLSPAPKPVAPERRNIRESGWMVAPMVVLAAACIVLGLVPSLAINYLSDAPEVAAAAGASNEAPGYWKPDPAAGLIVLGLLLGLVLVWLGSRPGRVRIVRPFLAGEVPAADDDRFRVPGTHFYETIGKLPVIGPLLANGERGAMDPYYWSGKHGHTLVELLRTQHTGLLSLYLVWSLVGLAVTLLYLVVTARA